MLAISAIIEVKAEHIEDFKALAARHAANSLKEEGCLAFDVFMGQGAPAKFYFHERYIDQAAVDAHGKTPYFADFLEQTGKWAVAKDIVVWTPLG